MDILLNSVQRLKEGLAFFDEYEPVPMDNITIYAVDRGDSLYEFASDSGALQVGDLRNILALLEQHGLVLLDANS